MQISSHFLLEGRGKIGSYIHPDPSQPPIFFQISEAGSPPEITGDGTLMQRTGLNLDLLLVGGGLQPLKYHLLKQNLFMSQFRLHLPPLVWTRPFFSQPERPDPQLSSLILFWLPNHLVMLRYWVINYPCCKLRRAGGRLGVNCAPRLWHPLPNQLPSVSKQVAGVHYPLEH